MTHFQKPGSWLSLWLCAACGWHMRLCEAGALARVVQTIGYVACPPIATNLWQQRPFCGRLTGCTRDGSHRQRRDLSAAPPAAATPRRLASHSQRVDHRCCCGSESDVEKLEHQMALPSRVARRRFVRESARSQSSLRNKLAEFSCELEPLIAAASSLGRAFAAQPSATVARREPGRLRPSGRCHSVATGRDWPSVFRTT